MTRLRSDSSSASATTDDESLVIPGCNNTGAAAQVPVPQANHQSGPVLKSAIESDSSTEEATDSDGSSEVVEAPREDISDGHSSVGYSNFEVLQADEDDDYSENDYERHDRGASSLLDEAVYEFGLTSARRFTLGHDQDYNLRPNFAILKHKTENISTSGGVNSSQENGHTERRFPRTPDWFFNIPDTRSPFPTFASVLTDDSD